MKLKRLILIFTLSACALLPWQKSYAQSSFHKWSHALDFSLSLSVGPFPFWEVPLPFFGVSYEYGVLDSIFPNGKGSLGVGASGEIALGLGTQSFNMFFCNTYAYLGGLASFHYEFLPKLDTYISPSLGVASNIPELSYGSFDYPYFNWNIITGTRYYFSSHFAAGLEYSWTWLSLRLGLTYQF